MYIELSNLTIFSNKKQIHLQPVKVYFNKQSSKEATGQIMTNTITYSIAGNCEATREQLVERLVSSFLEAKSFESSSVSVSLGEGLWGIELKVNDLYIGSIIGANGIHSEEDDLLKEYYSIINRAESGVREIGMMDTKYNTIHVNNYNQLLKYKHTPEQEMKSLEDMRYRYNLIQDYMGINKRGIDYNKRFDIYKESIYFQDHPILLELEGYNDEIICNLLYALHMVNDINKAIKSIRKDILRTYGPDWYNGLCIRLDIEREQFPCIDYGDGNIQVMYLENIKTNKLCGSKKKVKRKILN